MRSRFERGWFGRTGLGRAWARLQPHLWRRPRHERDLDDEIGFHLAEEARLRIEAGVPPREAHASARRDFGNVTLVTDVTRGMGGRRALEAMAQDLRYGIRLLVRHRLFAIFSIVSLALGIGGTSAVFSLFDAIVLRELPVHAPERLVTFSIQTGGRSANSFMPYPQFEGMRRDSRTLDGIFARSGTGLLSVGVEGDAAGIASGLSVTGDYHATLGVRPALGRLLTPADDRPGHAAVAVLSHAYWQRRFGGSASILGATITLNQVSVPFTVVGIEPAGFFGVTVGSAPDVVRALNVLKEREPPWRSAFGTWIEIMGRLRPGVSIEQAAREMTLIYRRVSLDAAASAAEDADEARLARETTVRLESGATGGVSGLRNGYRVGLRLLLMMLGGVLCLASLNVATLLLSRAESRRDEIATRLALGAGRGRIVGQLLTESAVIAVCGGVLGLLLAWRGSELLLRLATANAQALPIDLTPDARVVAFIGIVSAASCLLFGLLPAVRATASSRSSSARDVGGRRRRLLDRTLVTSQTALSLVLVVFAGLFLRSLHNLWSQETGYDRRNVLMFSIDAGLIGKRGPDALRTYQRVLDELKTVPGARAVTVSSVRPVSDNYYFIDRVTQVGDRVLTGDRTIRIAFNHLAPGYFETMGIPLAAGRDFDRRDAPRARKVAIVSEKLARRFEGNPVGQRLAMGKDNVCDVVGVAKDTRYASVKDAPRDVVYLPMFQGEGPAPFYSPTFEVRYAGTSAEMLRLAGEAVAKVDPALALFRAKTLDVQTRESFARERLLALLTTYFGGFALLLAGIGLYGLMTCAVTQRTREIGLRIALGARPAGIRWSVMRESAGTVIAGLAIGLAGALAAVRLVRTQLFGVEPADPTALAGVMLALLALAFCAAFIPARRASRIDPMTALRQE